VSLPNPEELLSAYASGGLSDSERAEVESYLEEHPEARAEVEALREVIGATREAASDGPAPHLGAMNARITAALDEVDREREAGGFWRFFHLPRLSPLWAGAAVAACAAVVIFVLSRGDDQAAETAGESVAITETAEPDTAEPPDVEGETEELWASGGDAQQDLEIAGDEELEEIGEDLVAALEEIGNADGDDEWEKLVLSNTDLSWIDELSEDELDLLDEALAELEAS